VRRVLDTNAAVSGLLWHGNPGKLIDAVQAGSLTLYTSAPLLAELHGVLSREKFTKHLEDRELTATQIFEGYAALTTVVVPAIIPPIIIEDPDDDAVLACAVCGQGRSRGFGRPAFGAAGTVRRHSHSDARPSGGEARPGMLPASNTVGVDFGDPRRARDQRRKIIAIAASAVAEHYRVDTIDAADRVQGLM
jgi:putative PIN family toxin of toxin-antitoxin system